jgi:hypothetical protein
MRESLFAYFIPSCCWPGLTFAMLDFQLASLDSEMAFSAVDLDFYLREALTELTGTVN